MKKTEDIMGMPISVEIIGGNEKSLNKVFDYFREVDNRFSTYKSESEITKINRGEILVNQSSEVMRNIFSLSKKTEAETGGYFSIKKPDGSIDPSGIVKGWSIQNAALLIKEMGYQNFFINAGGDIQSAGKDQEGKPWTIGIRNPFNYKEIVKVLEPKGRGVATSGTYIRGQHIYNPHSPTAKIEDIVSLTVVGPNIYEADRLATAAFAMGIAGIYFIENLPGFEAYAIDPNGQGIMTSKFNELTI